MSHRRRNSYKFHSKEGVLSRMWAEFWSPPAIQCPKCKSEHTEFYDPFFFAPIRVLSGRRRIQCKECRFIWRPSRSSQSIWDRLNLP
ncbi:MAG: hypothetical protein JW915_00380 [Chitinispirillaceae bacterium]|nr:hypothetical protein [Chitinispirillaceae bacterium]